jgi:hypothetical protein
MNNERYNQIIDKVYENYLKNFTSPECPPNLDVQPDYYEPMTKGAFLWGIKTNDEFTKKWGLKIEERELSLGERGELFTEKYPNNSVDDFRPNGMEVQSLTYQLVTRYNNANIPTKLITLTYNNETIESYE